MRQSFEQAGFSDDVCRFTAFDNSDANYFDPYQLLNALCSETTEPYLILCHQDVRLDLGNGVEKLLDEIARLNTKHPCWMLAGNAGVDFRGRPVLHLDDPHGRYRSRNLPARVLSLDENFLLIRNGKGLATSPGLSGFHLYGTDLCLNAHVRGGSAYVIDFLLTHLSGGNPHTVEYASALDNLKRYWCQKLWIGLVRTTTGAELSISRNAILRRLLSRRCIINWLWHEEWPLITLRRKCSIH